MIYLPSQPHEYYFGWQIKTQLHNLKKIYNVKLRKLLEIRLLSIKKEKV